MDQNTIIGLCFFVFWIASSIMILCLRYRSLPNVSNSQNYYHETVTAYPPLREIVIQKTQNPLSIINTDNNFIDLQKN